MNCKPNYYGHNKSMSWSRSVLWSGSGFGLNIACWSWSKFRSKSWFGSWAGSWCRFGASVWVME